MDKHRTLTLVLGYCGIRPSRMDIVEECLRVPTMYGVSAEMKSERANRVAKTCGESENTARRVVAFNVFVWHAYSVVELVGVCRWAAGMSRRTSTPEACVAARDDLPRSAPTCVEARGKGKWPDQRPRPGVFCILDRHRSEIVNPFTQLMEASKYVPPQGNSPHLTRIAKEQNESRTDNARLAANTSLSPLSSGGCTLGVLRFIHHLPTPPV